MDTEKPQGGQTETEAVSKTDTQSSAAAQVSIDWSKVEIPEDVIKNHPTYKSVLSESVERRKKLAELKSQLEDKPQTPAQTPEDDLRKTVAALQERLDRQERETLRKNIAIKHKLPVGLDEEEADASELITGETPEEMEASAKKIAALLSANKTPTPAGEDASPANSGGFNSLDGIKQRLADKLKGGEGVNPFDPGVQRQLGGGIVRKS